MADSYSALSLEDLREGRFSDTEANRLLAAEEAQWAILLLQGFGGIPIEDEKIREDFTRTVQRRWLDLAMATGILPDGEEPYEPGPVPGYLF